MVKLTTEAIITLKKKSFNYQSQMLRNNQRDHYIMSTILILQIFIAVKRYVHVFMKIFILLF